GAEVDLLVDEQAGDRHAGAVGNDGAAAVEKVLSDVRDTVDTQNDNVRDIDGDGGTGAADRVGAEAGSLDIRRRMIGEDAAGCDDSGRVELVGGIDKILAAVNNRRKDARPEVRTGHETVAVLGFLYADGQSDIAGGIGGRPVAEATHDDIRVTGRVKENLVTTDVQVCRY